MNVYARQSGCVYCRGAQLPRSGSSASVWLAREEASPTSSLCRLATSLQAADAAALSVELLVFELCAAS